MVSVMQRLIRSTLALILLLAALPAPASMAQSSDWGSITIRRDGAGQYEVILENAQLKVRYQYYQSTTEKTVIRDFILKSLNEDQAGKYLDGAANRGLMTNAYLKYSGPDRKTVRLEWNDGAWVEEVSIFPDGAYLQIDYLKYGIDVLDLGAPGQTTSGYYEFHGGAGWRRPYVLNPESYYNRHPGGGYNDPADGGALNDNGYFVGGVYNPENQRGYGRVMPIGAVDVIKLIDNRGFQFFPYYRQTPAPFTGYLFAVTGGPAEILAVGGQLAARRPLPPFKLKTAVVGDGSVSVSPDKPSYAAGETVTLTAAPAAGYRFSGWSGDLTGTANPAQITMTSAKTVTAAFAPAPPNQAPVLDPIGDRTVVLGATLAFTLTASDADMDPLLFSVTGLPTGAAFDEASGRFIWTPAAGDLGSRLMTFSVSDGQLSESETVAITVIAIPITGDFKVYAPLISK